ncbi:dihydropteroate synthase [Acinetobacter puyangensis]|uniref:Dihydropteroate synthase n=1 Tax=Acinetobacter puyangensis TaxID=1096779 RepID=A0A240E4V8_9GAMM|nr:dihydropteroate synthase [Acinetobacter puyangensis]SNX43798.1 dihydropteroate synthase [Acinetobacter puyangensis]
MHLIPLPSKVLNCGKQQLDLSVPHIMGILNVTPDSFSDGGLYYNKNQAIEYALRMIEDGASIIDIGGESTRPHAAVVSIEEELQRVVPVVEELAKHDMVLSIDTSQPEVMKAAVQAGAHIWNDVRALKRPQALETAAELDIPVVLMHMRGEPDTMNNLANYDHVTLEVKHELLHKIEQALAVGIQAKNIIIDPGFGFAKNASQNLTLLRELWQLNVLGYPILSALSRKRFIGEVLDGAAPMDRDIASVAGHLFSIQQGASIVRTHNVKATADAIKMWQAIQTV